MKGGNLGKVLIAEIAQLVEHNLAKVGVAGPSPVFRSFSIAFHFFCWKSFNNRKSIASSTVDTSVSRSKYLKYKFIMKKMLFSLIRAENGTRTRDPNLGKVVLYQLSYFRKDFQKVKRMRLELPRRN